MRAKSPTTEIYKGVEIRKYGTRPGESVYPICFTDDLSVRGRVKMHETWEDARDYIDLYTNN